MSPTILLQSAAPLFVVFLLMTVVALGLVVWTWLDAEKNSDHPAFLWAVVVFLAPILGIVLYLLLGRNATGTTGNRDGSRSQTTQNDRPPL